MDKNAGELARGDNELGDGVDGIVAVATEFLGRGGAPELAVKLCGSWIRISIDVEHGEEVSL